MQKKEQNRMDHLIQRLLEEEGIIAHGNPVFSYHYDFQNYVDKEIIMYRNQDFPSLYVIEQCPLFVKRIKKVLQKYLPENILIAELIVEFTIDLHGNPTLALPVSIEDMCFYDSYMGRRLSEEETENTHLF